MTSPAGIARDVAVVSCAVSAGVHGALSRAHFDEGAGAGLGFVLATGLLALLAVVLTRHRSGTAAPLAAAAALAGLIASYGLATTTGLPVLHPEAEPVDGLALFTKAAEAAGLLAALYLLRYPKGTLA